VTQKGYLELLDTVNFTPDRHRGGSLQGLHDDAFAQAMLIRLFHEIVLSPNQVLDLSFLRASHLDPSTSSPAYPFTFSVDSRIQRKPNPFTSQLAEFLRRPGDQAFIFSSLPNGTPLARQWGAYVLSETKRLHGIRDSDLLTEASSSNYAEIVDWAKHLDAMPSLNIVPYHAQVQFPQALSQYYELTGQRLSWLDLPSTRSMAYGRIEAKYPAEQDQFEAKTSPDAASNMLYARALDARLVQKSDSRFQIEPDMRSSLTLDLHGLFAKYPFVKQVLLQSDLVSLARARDAAALHIEAGWSSMHSDPDAALTHFTSAIKTFLLHLMEGPVITEVGEINVSPITGFSAAIKVPSSLVAKWRLRGIDKFTNFEIPRA